MSSLFIITLSDLNRTPHSTLSFASKYKHEKTFHTIGIDGRIIDLSTELNQMKIQLLDFIIGGKPSLGEIGCLLSHQSVYQNILQLGLASALILEEDAGLLVSNTEMKKAIEICENSDFELVSFYAPKGGVFLDTGHKIHRVLLPGTFALSYWISHKGAEKLVAKKHLLGLADWPMSIVNIKMGIFSRNLIANTGLNNSIIAPTLFNNSRKYLNISIRPLPSVLKFKNYKKLVIIKNEISAKSLIKYILLYRFFRRIARLISGIEKGTNKSIVLKFHI